MIDPCRRTLRVFLLLAAWVSSFAVADDGAHSPPSPSPDVTAPPAYDQFLVVPLRIHVLKSDDLPEVDCRLTDADIERIVGKVNRIWHNAGIHWGLESIVREPAARQGKFRLARDLDGPGQGNLGLFKILIPESSRSFDGLHVYYIHKFAVNGVWLGEDFALVQETAKLRPVEGGIDEPIPRVTAHELGHALGLQHRQDRTNLLASGTNGTKLNAREVETARKTAEAIKGAIPVRELRKKAEQSTAESRHETTRRFWSWLAEIPGEGREHARKQLQSHATPTRDDEKKPEKP